MAPRIHSRSAKKEIQAFSPKVTRQRARRKEQLELTTKEHLVDERKLKFSSIPAALSAKQNDKRSPMTIEDLLLRDIPAKQQPVLSSQFKEKMTKVGNALIALYSTKKELMDTDIKLLQLEETYGRTMKIQDLWNYHERAGLSAIIGQDPQFAMNAPHFFNDEERLMYNSSFPRPKEEKAPEPEASVSPPRPRTRARSRVSETAQLTKDVKKERHSTDDED